MLRCGGRMCGAASAGGGTGGASPPVRRVWGRPEIRRLGCASRPFGDGLRRRLAATATVYGDGYFAAAVVMSSDARSFWSSPDWNISSRMSLPPMNFPATYTCGMVGHCE